MNELTLKPIAEDRPLSDTEATITRWLLEHGEPRALPAVAQIERARVIARCPCGCASVDFSVDGVCPSPKTGMDVVSDYWWLTDQGHTCGIFVFLRADQLAGLEVWTADGLETPTELPAIERLRPYEDKPDA